MFFLSIISMAHAEPTLAESPQAIAIHFSERGFGHLGEGIAGLFPDVIPISGGSGSLDCSDETALDYTVGDIIGVALDLTNNKLYFRKNGTWEKSGDPTSGSTGTGTIVIEGAHDQNADATNATTTATYIGTIERLEGTATIVGKALE